MDSEERWTEIEKHRRAIADLLETLDDARWQAPSLCAGWRVRDVAAHLTTVSDPPSVTSLLTNLAAARGSFHTLNTRVARQRAQRPTSTLTRDLRDQAGSRRLPAVTNERNVLFDVLVHGQDIAVPLGLPLAVPPSAGADGATRVWTMGWPFWARRRLRGYRLRATDVEWSAGEGEELRGPVHALLLLLTGRTAAAAPLLEGSGLARLTGAGAGAGRRNP